MKITRQALDAVNDHARASRPQECCGILLMSESDVVDSVLAAENVTSAQPDQTYALGHQAHLKALDLECCGRARIAGYYHSHPVGPARPSPRDAEQAAPDTTYLIVGLAHGRPEPAAWQRTQDAFAREALEVIESHKYANTTLA